MSWRLFLDFALGIRLVFSFLPMDFINFCFLCLLIESLFFYADFSESKAAIQLSSAVPSLNL